MLSNIFCYWKSLFLAKNNTKIWMTVLGYVTQQQNGSVIFYSHNDTITWPEVSDYLFYIIQNYWLQFYIEESIKIVYSKIFKYIYNEQNEVSYSFRSYWEGVRNFMIFFVQKMIQMTQSESFESFEALGANWTASTIAMMATMMMITTTIMTSF